MSETSEAPRTHFFIYGSCVSRDTYELMDHGQYGLVSYVARQSLISAMGRPSEAPPALPTGLSRFQRRMIEGDISSNLLKRLEDALPSVDTLLWDLTDERLGVWAMPDGSFMTRTPELLGGGHGSALDSECEVVEFGSEQHFGLWTEAAHRWTTVLSAMGLLDRTIVLAPPWATTTATGDPVPSSFGLTAGTANRRYERYQEWLRSAGYVLIAPPRDLAVGSATHRWGIAPFHYASQTYDLLISAIGTACAVYRSFGPVLPHAASDVPPAARSRSARLRRADAVRLLTSAGVALRTAGDLRTAGHGGIVVVEIALDSTGERALLAGHTVEAEQRDLVLWFSPPKSRPAPSGHDPELIHAMASSLAALLAEHEGHIVLAGVDAADLLLVTAVRLGVPATVVSVEAEGDDGRPARHHMAVAASREHDAGAPVREILLVTHSPNADAHLDQLEGALNDPAWPSAARRERVITKGPLSEADARCALFTAIDVLRVGESASKAARALVRRLPQQFDDSDARNFLDVPRFAASRRGDGTIYVHADAPPAALPWLSFAFYIMSGSERLSIRWYSESPHYESRDAEAATHIHCFARHMDGSSVFVRLSMPA